MLTNHCGTLDASTTITELDFADTVIQDAPLKVLDMFLLGTVQGPNITHVEAHWLK